MFAQFLTAFRPVPFDGPAQPRLPWPDVPVRGCTELMTAYGGRSFNDGLYRLHSQASGERADRLIAERFPWKAAATYSFGYDWRGRQFALDNERREADEPLVLLLEQGTGDIYEIPATFLTFHNQTLIRSRNAALSSELFRKWAAVHPDTLPLPPTRCVGFRVPLFLGGKHAVDNLKVIDIDVDWSLNAQLFGGTRDVPEGTPIRGVAITE